jgi:hypothetical protein
MDEHRTTLNRNSCHMVCCRTLPSKLAFHIGTGRVTPAKLSGRFLFLNHPSVLTLFQRIISGCGNILWL